MRKNSGITLIALVITIIVMLILAGVSLNATSGENGVLTQAKSATFSQSVAVLEEYLNSYYVEHYDQMKDSDSKVISLKEIEPNWFFSTNLGYVPDSDGKALYLIEKSGLPNEIRNQLQGGDAGEGTYLDYVNLKDVYGVTSDLKVYYCSDGKTTMIGGVTENDLDLDNPNREVISSSSQLSGVLSGFDEDGDGKISAQESKSVKTLTISASSGITNLSEIGNLSSLENLTINGLNLENLVGLEKCSHLNYVYFQSCIVNDYSILKNLKNSLQYLYFYNINDDELLKICSAEKGIADADFTKLKYMAIVGNTAYINSTQTPGDYCTTGNVSSGKSSKTITTTAPLANLSPTTKKAINYLSLQNNNITTLSGISDYTNVILLRIEYNKLSNLSGIENFTNMTYLYCTGMDTLSQLTTFASGSKLTNLILQSNSNLITLKGLENCNSLTRIWASSNKLGYGIEGATKNENTDSIVSLKNKTSLYTLDLRSNTNLKWVDYIIQDTAIRCLYLSGCTGMETSSLASIKSIINNCSRVNYPSNYSLGLLDNNLKKLDLTGQTIKQADFESLKGKNNITHLILNNITLTDASGTKLDTISTNNVVNNVLSTMTGIQYLQIYAANNNYGISAVSTIDFVGNGKVTKLRELDIRGTSITNLSNLNDYATSLGTIIMSNENITLSNIQKTISRLYDNNYSSYFVPGSNRGLILCHANLFKKLEGLNQITGLCMYTGSFTYASGEIDLTGCTSLTKMIGYRSFTGASILKLPASLTNWGISYNAGTIIDFSECNLLTTIYLQDCTITSETQLNGIIHSMAGLTNLKTIRITETSAGAVQTLNCLSYLQNNNITDFLWTSNFHRYNLIDVSGLKNLKTLKNLTLDSINARDISALNPTYENNILLSGCPQLESININLSQVGNLDVLGNIPTLKKIIVTNSNVNRLGGFSNLINLAELNLTENCVYDVSSYTNAEGNVINYNITEVLANLNKNGALRKLYLSGNNIDNFSKLSEITNWTAYSGW